MDHKTLGAIPLASRVLAVAVRGDLGTDWTAYIDAVPGINHDREAQLVAEHGTKLPYEIAVILFPKIASTHSWRR